MNMVQCVQASFRSNSAHSPRFLPRTLYIYIYICIRTHAHICIFKHIYTHVHIWITYMCIYKYGTIHSGVIPEQLCAFAKIHPSHSIYMYIHIYTYTYTYMYIYIHVCICLYIYAYTYIHYKYAYNYIRYGMATITRLLEIIGLFCRISSLLCGSFAKETYNFKEPTNRSHPIWASRRHSGATQQLRQAPPHTFYLYTYNSHVYRTSTFPPP